MNAKPKRHQTPRLSERRRPPVQISPEDLEAGRIKRRIEQLREQFELARQDRADSFGRADT